MGNLMPYIVDTDQHCQNIRLKIDDILLDPSIQINHSVATDATVHDLILSGMRHGDLTGQHGNIAITHVAIAFPGPIKIGNRITLTENSFHNCAPPDQQLGCSGTMK